MAISMVRVKALCNPSELALVKASTRQEIVKHSGTKLRQLVERSRKLRDKWRDQAANQRRASQAKLGARDNAENKRTDEKAALFAEVLERFTAQLAKAEATGETVGTGKRTSTRELRSRGHRAERAEIRDALAEAKRELKGKKPKKVTVTKMVVAVPPAKKKAAKPTPVAAEASSVVSKASTVKKSSAGASAMKPKRSGKPFATDATPIVAGREAQGLKVTKQLQLAAETNAKQNRLKTSGLIRIQKNRSAANKRSQGRRDSR